MEPLPLKLKEHTYDRASALHQWQTGFLFVLMHLHSCRASASSLKDYWGWASSITRSPATTTRSDSMPVN
ncbi:hypothetical protein BD309DRAFT_411895 [Dichomitus squalens]|uniref:Uncharacterized protein n=1 Tax=Dichomitus squalens TaxID=114155 RepID=A0A4Q9P1G2_9APHY|nr:hypothetical protein BD311DRAFT_767174 [Dichomitus squalens]TBU47818.1 hypothetical protein BD309DRAFT_411895 [Dichomitus squalens]